MSCIAVDHQTLAEDNHHILQAIADEAGVNYEPGSGGRSYLAVPRCPTKKRLMEIRLQIEEFLFKEVLRIAY